MSVKAVPLALAALFVSQTSFAAGAYAGLSAGGLAAHTIGLDDSIKLAAVRGDVGYDFNRYLSIEGQVGLGASHGVYTVTGCCSGKLRVNSTLAGFAKANLPVGNAFDVYGLLGYGRIDLKVIVPAGNFQSNTSDSDVSYGLGADYKIRPGLRVFTDVLTLYKKVDTEYYSLYVGLRWDI